MNLTFSNTRDIYDKNCHYYMLQCSHEGTFAQFHFSKGGLELIVQTYEEACQALNTYGLLPLASFLPEHPSLESLTAPESWHTGRNTDPWLWRDYFAGEGKAAYGKFIGGKNMLIASTLFPLVKCTLSGSKSVEARYADGLLSETALRIHAIVRDHPAIDTSELRKLSGMRDKTLKSAYDRALTELQSSADIVISGLTDRLNDQGNKNGWNSTRYMLAEHWMLQHGIKQTDLSPVEAKSRLFTMIGNRLSEAAAVFLDRKFQKQYQWIGV